MKKSTVEVAFVVVFVAILAAGVLMFARWTSASTNLHNAKMALINEAEVFEREAQAALAHGWRVVAEDYLDDYKLGHLDEKFVQVNRDSIRSSRSGHGALAAQIAENVFQECQQQLVAETGDYPSADKVLSKLRQDVRIRQLQQLSSATFDVYNCAINARAAKDMTTIRQIDSVLQVKKRTLVRLMKLAT